MIGTVYDGGKTGMTAMMFGMPQFTNSNDSIIMNEFNNNNKLRGVSTHFMNSISEMNKMYNSNEVIALSKKLIATHGSLLNNYVMMIMTPENIKTPNLMMKQVIMSNPEVMRLDSLGVIDGYQTVTPDYDLHKFVKSGVLDVKDSGSTYSTFYGSAYDEYTTEDKDMIVHCWELVNNMLADGIDPTNKELSQY